MYSNNIKSQRYESTRSFYSFPRIVGQQRLAQTVLKVICNVSLSWFKERRECIESIQYIEDIDPNKKFL